jgi:hypothetical protein
MTASSSPTLGNGKICYLEIPTSDVARSAAFYRDAFGWRSRRREDGSTAFDDTVNEVSGAWVEGRPPATTRGLGVYVMVEDLAASAQAIRSAGGEIVEPLDVGGRVALFTDPAGNLLGIYEQLGRDGVAPIPEHLHNVTARIIVHPADEAIDFYRRAFGAELLGQPFRSPEGAIIHAEVRIGDSVVAITDDHGDSVGAGTPSRIGGCTSMLATYWKDVDAAWEQALAAGAEVVYPLEDQFYGERGGRLRDPCGQQWMLSQRTEILTMEEIDRRAADLFGSG